MEARLKKKLESIQQRGEFRRIFPLQGSQGRSIRHAGKDYLNFSSNNYLGLADDPRLKAAMTKGIERWGVGSGAARLVNGSMEVYDRLETALAEFKGCEAALLFNSGYHANIGALAALLQAGDVIFSDELNHASMIDGIRLSKAERVLFRHLDYDDLEEKLAHHRARVAPDASFLIAVEAVFSMDGDVVDLPRLLALAEKYQGWIYLDEAHATGVFGRQGGGLAESLTIKERGRLIVMGTLGKALGCFGAYIGASKIVIEYLRHRARSFVFTTTLPPAIAEAALEAIRICQREPGRRKNLWDRIAQFKNILADMSIDSIQGPIMPIHIGSTGRAMQASEELHAAGFWVNAIRPPTVPEGTSRLRVTLMATHSEEDVERLGHFLKKLRQIVQ